MGSSIVWVRNVQKVEITSPTRDRKGNVAVSADREKFNCQNVT